MKHQKMKLTAKEILKLYKKEYKPKPVSGYTKMTKFCTKVVEHWKHAYIKVGTKTVPTTVDNIAWALGCRPANVKKALAFYEANYGNNSSSKVIVKDEIDSALMLGSKREAYYDNELEYGSMQRQYKYSDVKKELK